MTDGPILIFDKSFLQSLSLDEAVWLQAFYRVNITPLFYAETLADLEKEVKAGRTPEQVVGNIAYKTPTLAADPNVDHVTLCISDLLGHPVPMEGIPIVRGGRPVRVGDRRGVVFYQPPEMKAMERWQRGDFLAVEREFALGYRATVSALNLTGARTLIAKLGLEGRRFRDLAEVKAWADQTACGDGRRYQLLRTALIILGIPERYHARIVARWKSAGGPALSNFAPYAT